MTKAQTPAQEPETPPEAQEAPEPENAPENGTSDPTQAESAALTPEAATDLPDDGKSTKAATFAEAAEAVQDQEYVLPTQQTSTDKLAEQGESKGLTFAEQAAKASKLYGSGNPSDKAKAEPEHTED